jgi:hypothetical protein
LHNKEWWLSRNIIQDSNDNQAFTVKTSNTSLHCTKEKWNTIPRNNGVRIKEYRSYTNMYFLDFSWLKYVEFIIIVFFGETQPSVQWYSVIYITLPLTIIKDSTGSA